MAICTADEIKKYYNDESMDDDILETLLATATAQIEAYCDRKFDFKTFTEIFHGGRSGTSKLFLTNYPVDLASEVKVYEDRDRLFPESTLIPSTDYYLESDTGILMLDVTLGPGNGNIKVVYSAGYAEDAMPGDLKQAVMEHTLRLYKEGYKGDLGQVRKQYADGSVELDRNPFYPSVQRTLDIYRNVVI